MPIMTVCRLCTKAFTFFSGLFLACLLTTHASFAKEEKPLWQLGLGVGGLNQSYYTGTSQTRSFLFPVILPIYRGEIIKADDRGMRAELLNNENLKLDVSLDFNLSIDSEDIDLRQGMPDIPNNLQIGPSLEYTLLKSDAHKWQINFPLRINIGFDGSDVGVDGATFSPNVEYTKYFRLGKNKWRFGATFGPQFGSSSYHDVYYGVADEFATSTRSAYQAEGGFTGYRAQTSLVKNTDKQLFVLFLRYENINGAVFEDSPLVETDDNLIAGFIYSYYLFNSKKMVRR